MFENPPKKTVQSEIVPSDFIWIDGERRIVKANQPAVDSAAQVGIPLIGELHARFDPDFPEEILDTLFSRKATALSYTRPSCNPNFHCCHCEDFLTLQEIDGEQFVIRCGRYLVTRPPIDIAENSCRRAIDIKNVREASAAAKLIRSEFIANMNHEIRTPMNAIIGYAEMLIGSNLEAREHRFAETIYRSGMTLVTILNDIMDLSKIESGRLKIIKSAVRLQDLIDESVGLYQDQISGKNLELLSSISSSVPEIVLIDGLRLKQVLNNLLSNAIKFTEQGSITLSVKAELDPSEQQAINLLITVEDTGRGIEQNDIEAINSILQPASDEFPIEYSGRGFGLPLCGRLVAMMGGTISLDSTLNKGTKLVISLPGVNTSLSDQSDEGVNLLQPAHKEVASIKLLVVDDMDLIKEVFIDYFSSTDVTVLTASTGETALKIAIEEKPSLIFMDLNLAGKDGKAVTRELRANPDTENIPVIAMTGNLLEEADYKPLFDEFLQKPFRFDSLRAIVAKYSQEKVEEDGQELIEKSKADTVLSGLETVWNSELNERLKQARLSGSLTAAGALGRMLKDAGHSTTDIDVIELGDSLIACAREHDIMGVEQILTKLHHFTVNKINE